MLSYTNKEKLGYNSISYNEQIEAIVNNKSSYNMLRTIQKTNLRTIRNKTNTKKFLTAEEKEYVFNLYYNFVVNKFNFDTKPCIISKPQSKATHIGMKMLEELNM
jgi:hypothetical protein